MKLALIFLSIFVAISHQQYFHPRMMFGFPWMSPFAQQPMAVHDYNEEVYPGLTGLNSRNGIDREEGFNDIQSRIRGFSSNFNGLSRYRPIPSLNDQQNARFFFNWANTGNNANNNNNNFNNFNPFFKTATFTLTSTLTLASIQSCVPSNNFAVPAPPACRRKRSESGDMNEEEQFPITPSEPLRLIPTALSSPQDRSLDLISSSRYDVTPDEVSTTDYNLREKRFFYANNKNFFIVSSTLTSYAFVNTTVTVTVDLIPPASLAAAAVPGQCDPLGAAVPQCIPCLPAGYIVCLVAGRR